MSRFRRLLARHLDDSGDLALLLAIPSLIVVSLLAVGGFTTLAAVVSIVVFLGFVPLVLVFGDSLVPRLPDHNPTHDPFENLADLYVRGELSQAALEREIERELADSPDTDEAPESTDVERLPEQDRT